MISPSSRVMNTPKPAGPGLPREAPSTYAMIFIGMRASRPRPPDVSSGGVSAIGRDARSVRARRPHSSLGRLQVENPMTSFAEHQLPAFELLIQRRTDPRAARAARVVRHLHHRHTLPLLENALELALQPFGKRRFERLRARPERFRLGTQVAEGVLPLVVLRVPPLLEHGRAGGLVVKLLLQPFDVGHRLQLGILELLDVLPRGVDLLPRCGVLLLVLHLHELPLILLEHLLLVGQLASSDERRVW